MNWPHDLFYFFSNVRLACVPDCHGTKFSNCFSCDGLWRMDRFHGAFILEFLRKREKEILRVWSVVKPCREEKKKRIENGGWKLLLLFFVFLFWWKKVEFKGGLEILQIILFCIILLRGTGNNVCMHGFFLTKIFVIMQK